MGHEIAHALREHGRERASQAQAQGILIGVIGAVAGVPQGTQDLTQLAVDLTFNLPNSREHETEADRIGVELAARAGYDPRGAISLWEKMGKLGGGQPPEFLSTHPSHATRIDDLQSVFGEGAAALRSGPRQALTGARFARIACAIILGFRTAAIARDRRWDRRFTTSFGTVTWCTRRKTAPR